MRDNLRRFERWWWLTPVYHHYSHVLVNEKMTLRLWDTLSPSESMRRPGYIQLYIIMLWFHLSNQARSVVKVLYINYPPFICSLFPFYCFLWQAFFCGLVVDGGKEFNTLILKKAPLLCLSQKSCALMSSLALSSLLVLLYWSFIWQWL